MICSRCITIHGTHNVDVVNNVAYDHIGHCYYLEDGGEMGNVFDGNLGIGTKAGNLTPSDSTPSTFWITSPKTKLVGNVAAGSDRRGGVGIWYIFPDSPVGLSTNRTEFVLNEAAHTQIDLFRDNIAHSNGGVGLGFFKRLGPKHEVLGCSVHGVMLNPLNKSSELEPLVFAGFVGNLFMTFQIKKK